MVNITENIKNQRTGGPYEKTIFKLNCNKLQSETLKGLSTLNLKFQHCCLNSTLKINTEIIAQYCFGIISDHRRDKIGPLKTLD